MAKHIMGENKHTSNGKHVCRRWNGLPHMNGMKYRPASCRAPITAIRTRRGGETADPPTGSLTQHTQAANMAIRERIHVEARVWQWHLHSLLNSFSLPNMHRHTHIHTYREPEAMGGAALGHKKKCLSPCRGSLWGLAWYYGKIRV